MKIVGRHVLDGFCSLHADARSWFENWLGEVGAADWRTPIDIKHSYAAASFLAGGQVVFNVKGNRHRLEVVVAFATGVVVVDWIGTHAAYDRRNRKRGRRN